VALGTDLLARWLASGGASGALRLPTTPPSWSGAEMITTGSSAGEQTTTGGSGRKVAFFTKGLIYDRQGLGSPDVMIYESSQMGFDTSARFRLQLLDQFTDKNGLVIVNYNLTNYEKANNVKSLEPNIPIADNSYVDTTSLPHGGNDDSAWMTGEALAAVSMAGDMDAATLILNGMLTAEWDSSGDLLRYPGNSKAFGGPDPTTQIAGCYFAWKFATALGDQQVQDSAKQVIGRWIDELSRNNGKLGAGGFQMLPSGLIELDEVAMTMGSSSWTKSP
jgi:hypothetical protein